ncbi:MAG: transporter related-protein, partial [Verrucomicrobiales bacterium]|nr:transporter related-protein [Verrucomicrobiales bacterium]
MQEMKNLLRALNYFRPDASRLGMVFLLMFGGIGLNVLKPWPLAIIVDSVLGNKPIPEVFGNFSPSLLVAVLSFSIFILHFGGGALQAFQNFLSIKIGLRGLTRVRNEVFNHLLRLSLRFHQGSNSGDMIYRASWDTYSFQTLFQQGLVTFVTSFISLLVMVCIMARLNLLLTVLALATVPLLVLAIKHFGKQMSERTNAAQQADSKVTSLVQQCIAAMPLIQSYTREKAAEENFHSHTVDAEQHRVAQHGAELLYWFSIAVVFGLGIAMMTWLGTHQVLAGKLTLGQLLVFLTYLAQLYEPLNQLSHVGATVSGTSASTGRVFEIIDSVEDVKDSPDARPMSTLPARGELIFTEVTFGYEKIRPVLRDISFRVQSGESVALIGPSGAGKTTLLNLLPRFFDPTAGNITLNGVDLRTLRLKELRGQIALVLQEPILLPTTIAENIAYGKPEATRPEIEAAAQAANAD